MFADKNVFDLGNVQIPSYDWTYTQFKEIAEKLTFSDNNTRYTGVFLPYHQNNVWQLFVKGFNGSWYENDAVNLTSGNSLEGINAMFSLLEQGYAKGLGFNYKGSDRSTSAMSIAFACRSDRNGHYLLSEDEYITNPATNYGLIDSGNAVLLPVPEFPAGKVGTCNTDFILGFAVNKDSKKKDAAAAFSLFSLTEKGQEILNEYYGGIPVNKMTWDKDFWKRGVLSGENANAVLYGIENDVRDDFFDAFMYEKNPYYWNLRTRVFFTCYMFRDYEKAPKNKSGSYVKYLKDFEDDINTMMISID